MSLALSDLLVTSWVAFCARAGRKSNSQRYGQRIAFDRRFLSLSCAYGCRTGKTAFSLQRGGGVLATARREKGNGFAFLAKSVFRAKIVPHKTRFLSVSNHFAGQLKCSCAKRAEGYLSFKLPAVKTVSHPPLLSARRLPSSPAGALFVCGGGRGSAEKTCWLRRWGILS